MGAYHHADDYNPSSALIDQPPASRNLLNAEVAAGCLPICTPTQTTAQVTGLEQDYSTQHITPDSSSNGIQPATGRQGRSRDIAGRLSVILRSLDYLVENIQGGEGVSPEEVTSLQRLREGLEVVREESATLERNRTLREASNTPVTGRKQHSASRTPGHDRESESVGDGRIPQPWVLT